MTRALVCGGAGFIGFNLCDRLLSDGHTVFCLDNMSAGRTDTVNYLSGRYKKFTFLDGDIRHQDTVGFILDTFRPDVIFNEAASKKNICLRDPREDCDVNAIGTLNLALMAKERGVKKFIHASTGSVYGPLQESPQTEKHPIAPCSYYGVSKFAGERYVDFMNLNTVILRYFHVYGPWQDYSQDRGGVVAIWAHKIWRGEPIIIHGDGTQQRSFTFVGDVVEANVRAMEGAFGLPEVYNCASGLKIHLLELIQILEKKIGKMAAIEFRPALEGDIHTFDISNEKIKDRYNMEFKSLEDGLDETLGYYKPTN